MRPVKCVKVPCRSIPQRSLARHQLGLFGQLLLPSIQLRQGPGAEIAFGDLPLVVLLPENRADEPYQRSLGWEDTYHVRSPFDLLVDSLQGVVRPDLLPMFLGEGGVGQYVFLGLPNATGSEVHLAYAMQEERYRPHLRPEMWEGWQEGFEQAKRSARSWVEGEAERMRGEGTNAVESHLLIGRPDAAIVWLAEELGAGLVVVGSRGLRGIRRALIGSVSDSVVRHAHCPVMVMRT
jgi:nucleotide-binding universal stress UspA family protein